MEAKGRANLIEARLFTIIVKRMVTSRKTIIRENKIRRKKKGKRIDQAGVADSGVDDGDLLNVRSSANNSEDS